MTKTSPRRLEYVSGKFQNVLSVLVSIIFIEPSSKGLTYIKDGQLILQSKNYVLFGGMREIIS
jgi:hypothetical protein